MPNQVVPITELASVGLVMDTPSTILPPNAFSDVSNVRFHDGAITKFPAESQGIPNVSTFSGVVYAALWPAPSGDRYVVVSDDETNVTITVYSSVGTVIFSNSTLTSADNSQWQHTIFNGGFHIIINDGTRTPVYLEDGVNMVRPLPGWDSYASQEQVMDFDFDGNAGGNIDISVPLEAGTVIKFTCIPRNGALAIRTDTLTVNDDVNGFDPDGTIVGIGTAGMVTTTGFRFTPGAANGGNRYVITLQSAPIAIVTASVVRAYGNLLVAGNLIERDEDGAAVRTLTGTIRTSDVAGPGQIPTNWNPFQLGVNTADEFILASTGTIQDMVELQGVLYVYTDSSIHSIQQTGSPVVPFQTSPVTNNFGANGVGSVLEVDGKHIVVGSDDVYVFAGHPGSISSISDGRVRDKFRGIAGWKIVRLHSYDELWFWRLDDPEIYIWNYRSNVWTKRTSVQPVSIDTLQSDLLLATTNSIVNVNKSTSHLGNAYIQRDKMALAPEFDTENLASIAFLAEGDDTFEVLAKGSNAPGENIVLSDDNTKGTFDLSEDYKKDIREQGRFLNYRITHSGTGAFTLAGMQLDIMKGGTR